MKHYLVALMLSLMFAVGPASMAYAQAESASTTQNTAVNDTNATSTTKIVLEGKIIGLEAGINAVAATTATHLTSGLPEWGTDKNYQNRFWGKAAALIGDSVAKLPASAEQKLAIPILFGVAPANITRNFGDARGGGRTHEGLDMMAVKGVPVVSPTPAVVLGAGTGPSAGNYVYTANPGGETFVYMHLDQSAPLTAGTMIPAGGLIGYVGNTGNAAACLPHLHLEIRKNGPTDPYARLAREFALAEKITFLSNILPTSNNKTELVNLVAANYAVDIAAARKAGLALPVELGGQIVPTLASSAAEPWSGLVLGEKGSKVTELQNFLIARNSGPATAKLARCGATGYFGALTNDALAEYRASGQKIAATAPGQMSREQILARIVQIKELIASLQAQLQMMRTTA